MDVSNICEWCGSVIKLHILRITDNGNKLAMTRKALDWSWKYFFLSIRSSQWAEFCSTWRRFRIE